MDISPASKSLFGLGDKLASTNFNFKLHVDGYKVLPTVFTLINVRGTVSRRLTMVTQGFPSREITVRPPPPFDGGAHISYGGADWVFCCEKVLNLGFIRELDGRVDRENGLSRSEKSEKESKPTCIRAVPMDLRTPGVFY